MFLSAGSMLLKMNLDIFNLCEVILKYSDMVIHKLLIVIGNFYLLL